MWYYLFWLLSLPNYSLWSVRKARCQAQVVLGAKELTADRVLSTQHCQRGSHRAFISSSPADRKRLLLASNLYF